MDPVTLAVLIALGIFQTVVLCVSLWKWLVHDTHRDVIVLLGPKESGKTEFLSALKGEMFEPDKRLGTGTQVKSDDLAVGEKKIICLDSGGEKNNTVNVITKCIDQMKKHSAEYLCILFIVDLTKIDEGVVWDLAGRIRYFDQRLIKDKRFKTMYQDGKCGYALVGTHAGDHENISNDVMLSRLVEKVDKKRGSFRCLNVKRTPIEFFELSEDSGRKSSGEWLLKTMKKFHH